MNASGDAADVTIGDCAARPTDLLAQMPDTAVLLAGRSRRRRRPGRRPPHGHQAPGHAETAIGKPAAAGGDSWAAHCCPGRWAHESGMVLARLDDVDGAMATWRDFLDCADGIRSVKVQAALQGMRVRRRYSGVPEAKSSASGRAVSRTTELGARREGSIATAIVGLGRPWSAAWCGRQRAVTALARPC